MAAQLTIQVSLPSRYLGSENIGFFEDHRAQSWASQRRRRQRGNHELIEHLDATNISTQNKSYPAHIFDAIQTLCLSPNRPRDRQIADRLINLHRDVLAEGEQILTSSLSQFVRFFVDHPDVTLPKITMTPDGTLRVRWISGQNSFVAIEFTGRLMVKLVTEIPRPDGQTATYFGTEMLGDAVPFSRALGASFG